METNQDNEVATAVLVFKTNIATHAQVEKVSSILSSGKNISHWNVDMEDIDNVLRIECAHLSPATVIKLLRKAALECEELPD